MLFSIDAFFKGPNKCEELQVASLLHDFKHVEKNKQSLFIKGITFNRFPMRDVNGLFLLMLFSLSVSRAQFF